MPKETRTIAKVRKEGYQRKYDPKPFVARIKELLEERNLTSRAAALGARLDHQAMYRIYDGKRPNMMACILLADYFELNPNELLDLAAWPTLEIFEVRTKNAEKLPPEAVDVAMDIAKIENPGVRKEVAKAIRTLLAQYFTD